jgi:hypothetical protein
LGFCGAVAELSAGLDIPGNTAVAIRAEVLWVNSLLEFDVLGTEFFTIRNLRWYSKLSRKFNQVNAIP